MRDLIGRRSDPSGEGGVTMVIVALSLLALLGMVVLVVDVGGLLLNRREMVNASDAAALAAAKTCAVGPSVDVYGKDAEHAADVFALQNSPRAQTSGTNIIGHSTQSTNPCNGQKMGYVTVRYTADQQLFFAGVLGAGASKPVTTQATAIWGPARTATPVPLTIYTQSLGSNCDVQTLPKDSECYFWFDNSNFGTSRFGILDLRPWDGTNKSGWDVPGNTQSCGQGIGASDLSKWVSGVGVSDLEVNYPATTYVCIVEGTPESQVWGSLEAREGQVLTFPINRCDTMVPGQPGGQVANSGTEVPCSVAPHKYDIIGFVDFRLVQVLQSQGEWGGTSRTTCQVNNFSVTKNTTYPLYPQAGGGCPSSTPSGLVNLTIDGKAPTDAGAQYTVDSATNPTSFTWTGPDSPPRVKIQYDWWQDGACGEPPGSSSAVCIRVQTVEVRVGGGSIGNGSDLGNVRAVRLCDPAVLTSCAPVNVPAP